MADFTPTEQGIRLASLSEEGKGYFFTPLGFLKNEDLLRGLFVGGRRSSLTQRLEVPMEKVRGEGCFSDFAVGEAVRDCNVKEGSSYCSRELRAAKELGTCSFLRYLHAFFPADKTLHIYVVKDV